MHDRYFQILRTACEIGRLFDQLTLLLPPGPYSAHAQFVLQRSRSDCLESMVGGLLREEMGEEHWVEEMLERVGRKLH